jgi:hypothetical protein
MQEHRQQQGSTGEFRRKNLGSFCNSCRGGTSDQNSPKRTSEVTRTVRSRGIARWIREDEPINWYQESTWIIDHDLS